MSALTNFLFSYMGLLATFVMAATAFAWYEWEVHVLPARIPKAEIDAIADGLIEKHGPQAEYMAFLNEDHEWHYSHPFERGKWLRVRKELWRRYEAGEWAGPDD